MRMQRNMSQIKEQDKTPENLPNKMEISSYLIREFKVTAIKRLTGLERRADELSGNFKIV